MLDFILRRVAYSVLVILGVVVLTFLLFRIAAGDPAAAVLGKSPSAAEIESLRTALGADLPLFYGHWRRSEVFGNAVFADGRMPAGAVYAAGEPNFGDRCLLLEDSSLILKRQISTLERVRIKLELSGDFMVNNQHYFLPERNLIMLEIPAEQEEIVIAGTGQLFSVGAFRPQDSPWDSQFFAALGEIVRFENEPPYISFFNFGNTVTTREPIRQILWRGMWPSLALMFPIFLGELILGLVLALLATAFKDRWPDRVLMFGAVAGMSISYLVVIIAGQWLFGYYWNWFPVWGWGDIRYLVLPVAVGVLSGVGGGVRFYRTVFVNELNQEYLRTAAAKGGSPWRIYTRHLLRNAAIPVITRASAVLPFLFTGSLLLETFFGIPGLGYAGIEALNNSDLQLLKALVILSAMLFVILNLLADLAYAWADPRVRLQ